MDLAIDNTGQHMQTGRIKHSLGTPIALQIA
jgi:hypothetical protein